MEILNSGSFITLDNRDKIEQLIFTSRELARAVVSAEGFVNHPATNQSLGLEMWQGAEYVTRAHEEATIKNIFLSNFLQQLRELPKQQTQQPSSTPPPVVSVDSARSVALSASDSMSSDEYLGLVESSESNPTETTLSGSYAEECVPPGELEASTVSDDETGSGEIEAEVSPTESSTEAQELRVLPDTENKQEASRVESAEGDGATDLVESIALAEKEPYNFDSCTVTAVVQLLPIQGDTRRCVISVRTHDFTPQVTVSELRADQVTDDILNALQASYSQYRTDLPARSAEKLKKEKTAGKKRSTKASEPAKKSQAPLEAKADESGTNEVPVPSTAAPAKDQGSLFAAS